MARRKRTYQSDDEIAHSVRESPGITPNRTRQEVRIGSGNRRRGQAQSMRRAGAISSSKTGAAPSKGRTSRQTRAKKRRSKR